MTTPDQPLKSKRYEQFAQLVAIGESRGAAYQASAPKPVTAGTARQNGMRAFRRPDVAARIQWLRTQHLSGDTPVSADLTQDELLALMGEATTAYEQAIAALESVAGNPRIIAQMRSDLVVHVGRLHRLQPAKEKTTYAGDDHVARGLANLRPCTCHTAAQGHTGP